MDDYDEFEATLLEAGWTLDEIEKAWQNHSPEFSPVVDTWDAEDWDRD